MGRAAGVDASGAAVLPPAALSPVTRYKQEPEDRSGIWSIGRLALWALAGVAMVVVAVVAGDYLFIKQSVEAVRPHSRDVIRALPQLAKTPTPGHAAIALIVGYDHRANEAVSQPSRSDTVMLVRTDPVTHSISMLSFPRDLQVNVECPGKPTFVGKINAAYSECGSRGALKTVRDLTGLPVNFLITVDFHGFKEIVDKIGGVWLNIDQRYFNNNAGTSPGYGYATINLQPGYQKLTGGAALDFVRYRHTDSDIYRNARQQQFLEALKQQFRSSITAFNAEFKLPSLISAITHSVEVGEGGGRQISPGTVYSYAKFVLGLPPGHFFQARIGGLSGYGNLVTDPSNIQQAVQDLTHPDVSAPKVATAVALGHKIRSAVPKPANTSIIVLNGNGQPGAAATAGSLLGQRGYHVITTGNGVPTNYNETTVYYDPAQPGARAAAGQIANQFAPAQDLPLPPQLARLSGGAMELVVVGQTFHNAIGPAPVVTTPTREAPRVRVDPTLLLSSLRAMRRKVPFRIENPSVVEDTSYPDREAPLRLYDIQGKNKALRLTFRLGGLNEYWGIEETAWADAPILGDRNFRHVLRGREFDFYYSGSHLHMIVLRENGGTYWVVNTLLDSLSNETMLAIARGLHPLPRR
jgi:LCP family protein required for cell wall assembly